VCSSDLDAMISAIIAPKIEFKKKKKEGLDEASNN
jgi:hypothetical protein